MSPARSCRGTRCFGSYAIAYSTPGALEVVDSLTQPFATDQKVCLLDVLLRPEHVGKPYAEVAALAIERRRRAARHRPRA